jgi:hypothetical protein
MMFNWIAKITLQKVVVYFFILILVFIFTMALIF